MFEMSGSMFKQSGLRLRSLNCFQMFRFLLPADSELSFETVSHWIRMLKKNLWTSKF